MTSLVTKVNKMVGDIFIATGKAAPRHTNHYRPYNYKIQKEQARFDNDFIDTYVFDDDSEGSGKGLATGTNKKEHYIHDKDGFDRFKQED